MQKNFNCCTRKVNSLKKQFIALVMVMAVFMFVAGTVKAGLFDRVLDIAEDAVKKEQPKQAEQQTGQSTSEQPKQSETQKSSAVLTDNTVYSPDSDAGVVINGVKWATRNVDAPGKFTANPSEAGMIYQWNRKKAWPATGKSVENWDNTYPAGETWKSDISPAGWRLPTIAEVKTLFDTNKVSSEWTTQNGVKGRKYTDKATGNSIFLPAVGYRNSSDEGRLSRGGEHGCYWTGTGNGKENAWSWGFDPVRYDEWAGRTERLDGRYVRPIAK